MAKVRDPAHELAQKIHEREDSGATTKATLQTDDRVLARITDGIYRQPASALRELIANAYDADAKSVYIETDVPRFNQLTVKDDGLGLSTEALANLIHHIGGSPKRTPIGVDLGIARPTDPSKSPGGRKLIGKIGIGLFSVAQLTHHFQIISKVKSERFRRIADVVLKTYTEEELERLSADQRTSFETGSVRIWSVPATDTDSQGTEMILMDLRQQTKDMLQSHERWLRAGDLEDDAGDELVLPPPRFHIGCLDPETHSFREEEATLPWNDQDEPDVKFRKLYQAVLDQVGVSEPNPRLETTLDNYLRTIWTLSLSIPLDYIDSHPFDTKGAAPIQFFELSNNEKGKAKDVKLRKNETLREKLNLSAPERGRLKRFEVVVDGVQLFRPLRFTNLPKTSHALKELLMFAGRCEPDLTSVPKEIRGGGLAFEGYFFWTPKVVPKEHNGILVRIADASGTLFDETFMRYQVSEQTRLRQLTAEIFVFKGLDAALNIDRESFNYAHPHYQYLTKWVHRSLRQFATRHKALAADVRESQRAKAKEESKSQLDAVVDEELEAAQQGLSEEPPIVEFVDGDSDAIFEKRDEGVIAFDREAEGGADPLIDERVNVVIQILDSNGLLNDRPHLLRQKVLQEIAKAFGPRNDKDQ